MHVLPEEALRSPHYLIIRCFTLWAGQEAGQCKLSPHRGHLSNANSSHTGDVILNTASSMFFLLSLNNTVLK